MTTPLGAVKWAQATITKTPTDSTHLGWFEGYVSTWDIDRDNERFARGAFAKSVVEWATSGRTPPVLYAHDKTRDPANIVGRVLTMAEDQRGLKITAQLSVTKSARADAVFEALLAGALTTMSIGFISLRWDYEKDVRVITEAEVLECSLTPVPANPHAVVTAVKAARASDDVQRLRDHLMTSHAGSAFVVGKPMSDLIVMHRLVHADTSASQQHITTGSVDGGVTVEHSPAQTDLVPKGRDPELEEYKRRLDELAGNAPRPKLDGEVRAEVNKLFDEHVLKEKLDEFKADAIIFEARQRRQEREEKQRAINLTEVRR